MKLWKHVSRKTSTRNILKMYLHKKAAMKKCFKANKQRVSITTDIWVAQVTRKFFNLQ